VTSKEYLAAMAEALGNLPEPFRRFVQQQAYDRGHSGGSAEIVNVAGDLAYGLREAVAEYDAHTKADAK